MIIILLIFDGLLILVICRIDALMIIDSPNCKWKIMKTEEIEKKRKINLIFQFQTTKNKSLIFLDFLYSEFLRPSQVLSLDLKH